MLKPYPRDGRYLISDEGRIKGPSGRWLKFCQRGAGVYLVFRPGSRTTSVHVAVCETFHGPRPPGQVVRHLNGDPQDNRAQNLAWGTRSENMRDAVRHGTCRNGNTSKTHCIRGHELVGSNLIPDRCGRRICRTCRNERSNADRRAQGVPTRDKLNPEAVKCIRWLYANRPGATQKHLADAYGISQTTVSAIVNWRAWKDVP